jgi:uncharacterized membrane protein
MVGVAALAAGVVAAAAVADAPPAARAEAAAAQQPAVAQPSAADLAFFETKVRPVLVERCYKCHSAQDGKDKGGLTVDGRAALLKGGDNGPSVVPGEPGKSKLIEAVSYKNVDLQMPPKGKLTDAEVADLAEWVRRGAPWPAEQGGAAARREAASGGRVRPRRPARPSTGRGSR